MIRYRVTIASPKTVFCAVFEVCAFDAPMAVFRAMANAELKTFDDYDIKTTVLERIARPGPAVVLQSVTA